MIQKSKELTNKITSEHNIMKKRITFLMWPRMVKVAAMLVCRALFFCPELLEDTIQLDYTLVDWSEGIL